MKLPRTELLAETIARYGHDDDPFEALSAILCAFNLIAQAAAKDIEKRDAYPMRRYDVNRWKLAADRAITDAVRHNS